MFSVTAVSLTTFFICFFCLYGLFYCLPVYIMFTLLPIALVIHACNLYMCICIQAMNNLVNLSADEFL